MRYLLVEYVEVGSIFVGSVNHGLNGGFFVSQRALTGIV